MVNAFKKLIRQIVTFNCIAGCKVAIKTIDLNKNNEDCIYREYYVYKNLSNHENFLNFHGMYMKRENENAKKIWLVMEV